jgi:hypothetical protein
MVRQLVSEGERIQLHVTGDRIVSVLLGDRIVSVLLATSYRGLVDVFNSYAGKPPRYLTSQSWWC